MKQITGIGVGLPAGIVERSERLGRQLELSRSDVLRRSIEIGFPLLELGHRIDPIRLLAHIEYLQAALETIIARDHPEMADRLLDMAVERVEQFHA